MSVSRTMAFWVVLIAPVAAAQESQTPGDAEKKTTDKSVEFRWLENQHTEGITDPKQQGIICPSCSATHQMFAHIEPVGAVQHIVGLARRPKTAIRCYVRLSLDKKGVDKFVESATKTNARLLGAFVDGKFAGVLSRDEVLKKQFVLAMPKASDVERFCSASNMPPMKPPKQIARFLFNDQVKNHGDGNVEAVTKNVVFRDGFLYVNGKYAGDSDQADRALTCNIKTPALNFDHFTFAIRFKALRIQDAEFRNIFCGGDKRRWFRLGSSKAGRLTVYLDDDRSELETPVKLKSREWYTVVCQCDFAARTLLMQVNGRNLEPIKLPSARIGIAESEKVWSFTDNRRRGSVFHGLVDELVFFDGTFWPGKLPKQLLLGDKSVAK